MNKLIVGFLSVVAFAQQNPSSITLEAPAPPPVRWDSISVSATNRTGSSSTCYWVVANYTRGKTNAIGPTCIDSLSATSVISVGWGPTGATSYDVLRYVGQTLPNGTNNIKVGTTASSTITDTLAGVLSAYTPVTAPGAASATATLDNRNYTTPTLVVDKPVILPPGSSGGLPAGTGAVAVTNGVANLVPGNVADCVKVDGTSGACGNSGIGVLASVAGNPNQLGTACPASVTQPFFMVQDNTTGHDWLCGLFNSLWYDIQLTLGTGPYTISAISGNPASGTAAARPPCAGGTLGTLYYATDTFALTPCIAETAAWGTALNSAGRVAILLNTTTGSIDTYDSTRGLTTGNGISRSVCAEFNGGGSALIAGSTVGSSLTYLPALLYGGTLVSWEIRVAASGTIGVRVWRTTSTTVNPVVGDSITSADLAIASNTYLVSTDMTNFTGSVAPTFAVGDSIAIQLNAAATATWAQFCLNYR